jgi:hypothetical protein
MALVSKGEVLGCSNKKLRFFCIFNGSAVAVASLQFIIYDVSTPANLANPVQVYPGSGRQTSNLADCPTGDHIAADGGYVATLTFPSGGSSGLFEIRWFWQRTTADVEQQTRVEFWVL